MLHMLIVEDDERLRDLFVQLLRLKGHHVREARDGAEAVTLATRESPDLIVMDVKMPKLDGISAVRQIRSALPTARIILISGYRATPELEAITQEGRVIYLHKPFTFEQFLTALDQLTTPSANGSSAEHPTGPSSTPRAA